ncbi:MAG TPA: HD domain-containing phosphohydrolase [Gemmatimonadaceae bacterium]|jgi:putative nucleotidyltransferase with HDIG domain|nr:HD domain-containing phosphohydrolase [Gemmatimonadaceae bacterium]
MTAPGAGLFPTAVEALVEKAQQAERSGRREQSRQHYETALYLLGPGGGVAAVAIIRRIIRSYVDDGQFDAAFDCCELALAIADALDDVDARAHARNLLAIAHLQRGDLDDAAREFSRALEIASTSGDERLTAMIAQNLGIIASLRGDLVAALDHYSASLITYRAAGLRDYVGPVLNNMGLVYTQLDRLDEAQAAYDDAVVACIQTGDIPHQLLALINSASLWIARGDVARAAGLCEMVLTTATAASDYRALGETYKHLGVIARMRGDLAESERQLSAAYNSAMSREDLLLAAETAREQAELYEIMGKNRDTLQSLTLSHRLFTKLRAQLNLADLQRRVSRLEDRFYLVAARWGQTIESKDAYTLGHCERVADYACVLARDVGFDDITMFWFRMGAVLHDVGKIVVPSEILNKPGPLDAEERAVMERHAAAGSDLLREIDFPWDILPMVRGHHERWDGRGYPDGLAAENIALSARITCVADVFDALTTDRPYRPAFSHDEAMSMMAANSGKMFDPELFARFERLVCANEVFRRLAERQKAAS